MIIYSTWGDDYMDIPLAYIIFDIMISLKKNNRDTIIYRDILIIYLKRFINSFDPLLFIYL